MYMDNSVVDVHHVRHWTQGLNYNTWNPFLGSPELKNSNVIWPKRPHLLGVLVMLLLLLHLFPANSSLLVWLQQRETCPQLSLEKLEQEGVLEKVTHLLSLSPRKLEA